MPVMNVTQARDDLSNIVDTVQNGEKVIVTSKNGTAVIIGEAAYNSLEETLYLLSDPDMAKDIADARKPPSDGLREWPCLSTESE